jgi:hypothetical protein
MKSYLIIFATAMALGALADDRSGTWKVHYAGTSGSGPRTAETIILDLKVEGTRVAGTAHIGSWPGDAPIADGKIDGNRITFTATGSLSSTTGTPTCQFVAVIRGDEMLLTMTTIKNPNGVLGYTPNKYQGKKLSK